MNKIHQLIWSARLGCCVAVSEVASSAGARRGSGARRARRLGAARAAAMAALAALAAVTMGQAMAQVAPAPTTLPTGGQVVQGQANLRGAGSTAAPVLNIDQASQRAVINWGTFNLGAAATVNFNQPNAQAATLNRVQDMNPSQIFGHINAPGQVTLINPAGVYFSPGAVLDVGALTATTMQQSDADFMAGGANFTRSGSTGRIVNAGTLQAALGGYIALLAPEVRNEGLVVAQQGTVALASGEAIRLNFDPQSRLTSMTVTPSQIAALVENKTAVQVGGGQILLSATAVSGLQGSVVNSGSLSASSLTAKGGRIVLEGDRVALASGSSIDARGATGGGTVLVGGDWQGAAGTYQATTVTMAQGATIDASATQSGDGGKVVLWSDVGNANSVTIAQGSIYARGGALGGNGGKIETSGHRIVVDGVGGDAAAPKGTGGEWLFDPYDVTISSSATSNGSLSGANPSLYTATGNSSNILNNDIENKLNAGTSVTISTVGAGSQAGNILVTSGLTKNAGGAATLTLKAEGSIKLQGAGSALTSTTGGVFNIVLWADTDANNVGSVWFDTTNIVTKGGSLWAGGGAAGGSFIGLAVGSGYATSSTNSLSNEGVVLHGTTIDTTNGAAVGGSVMLQGKNDRVNGTETRFGVLIDNSSNISTGVGSITVDGTMTALQPGSNYPSLRGVQIDTATLQTTTGAITITGSRQGYNQNAAGTFIRNATVQTTGATGGNISITGTQGDTDSGTGTGALFQNGIFVEADGASALTTIKTNAGNILLNGTNKSTNSANSAGLLLYTVQPTNADATNPTIKIVSATGNVTLKGDNPNNTAVGSYGVQLNAANYGKVYIGFDGTTAYSGNTDIQGRSFVQQNFGAGYLFLQGSGALTIEPLASSNASFVTGASTPVAINFDTTYNFGSSHSSVNLGGVAGNTGSTVDTTVSNALTAAGPISIYGGNVALNANLTTTAAGGAILAKGSGNVTTGNNQVLQTNGGAITLWADSDAAGGGYILLNESTKLDSRTAAARTTNAESINATSATGGGDITLGGGNGATAAAGYAWSTGTAERGGVNFGDQTYNNNAHTNLTTIYSGGGNILVRGKQTVGTMMGINWVNGGTLNAGTGTVTLDGTSTGGNGIEIGSWQGSGSANIYAGGGNAGTPAITVTGANTTAGSNAVQTNVGSFVSNGAGGIGITGSGSGSGSGAVVLGLSNLTSTVSGAAINVRATGSITTNNAITLATNNSALLLASDTDNSGGGIFRANGNFTANTSGGAITIGGGDANGTGYATGFAADTVNANGVRFKGTSTFNSGGGNISLKGKSYTIGGNASNAAAGLWFDGSTSINSGTGTVYLEGVGQATTSTNDYTMGMMFSFGSGATTSITSANTTASAITLIGNAATAANANLNSGMRFYNDGTSITATGSGGGITLTGTRNTAGNANDIAFANSGGTGTTSNILANGGAINLNGNTAGGQIFMGAMTLGRKLSTTVTSSISNVTITADGLNNILAGTAVNTSGTLKVQPFSNNFSSTLTWPVTNLTLSNDVSGLTLGRDIGSTAHTDTITIGSATSIAGPISIYGGNINLNANLTSTLSGAAILAKASGNITSNASRSFQTNNGDLIFWSNASNVGTAGALTFGDSNTFNTANGAINQATGGGKIVMAGGLDDGLNGGTASDGVPDGFASSSSASGIVLGTTGTPGTTSMYSGGGNILLRGNSTGSGLLGIQWNKVGTVDAGNGTVSLVGTASQGHGIELGASSGSTSITAGGGDATHAAISIVGTNTLSTTSFGIQGNGGSMQAKGDGGITVTGTTNASSTAQGTNLGMDALAKSGPIAITAIGGTGLRYGGTLGKKASTGVLASSSNVTLTGDALTVNSGISVDTTGTLTVQPYSNNFTNTLNWPITGLTLASTVSGLTLGKDLGSTAHTDTITVGSATSIAGPINIYAGTINLNANLTSTLAGAAILAKASGNITSAASTSLKTNNGNLTLWSDSDNNSLGSIALGDNNTLNTSLNGASTSQATGGGKITLAGGADTNADGIPDGYAFSATDQGLSLGTSATNTTAIYSGGGDVLLKGKTSATSGSYRGIKSYNALTVNSGQGAISMAGESAAGYGIQFSASSVGSGTTVSLTSAKTSGTAISITGISTLLDSHGVVFDNSAFEEVLATGGGSIAINGTGNGTGYGVWLQNTNVLASTGAITVDGGTKGINVATGANFGKSTSGVTASTSNVTLTGDVVNIAAASTVDTTGTLTVQPFSTSFSSALSWPLTNLTVAPTLTGLTLGKLGNLADITVASDQSINGPISIYGGNVALNASLASTATATAAATMVKVLASGDITLALNKTVTTQGGSVLFNSDADGNGAGAIVLGSGSGITSTNGNITLGGGSAGTGAGNAVGDSAHTAGIAIGGTLNVGAGALVARGQGYAGASNNYGIALNTATVTASGAGTIDLTGTGGAGTGTNNIGINGNGTLTGGSTGALTLTGFGGAATGGYNYGIGLGTTTVIGSGGGNVNLIGTAGGVNGSSSGSNTGIYLFGTSVNSSGAGVVNVTGFGGPTTGGYNYGVQLGGNSTISTTISGAGGTNVTGTGRSSSTASNNAGVDMENASVITGGTGAAVVVTGSSSGGTGTPGSANYGVLLQNASGILSGGGTINVTGIPVSGSHGVYVGNTATIASGGDAAVTVTTDSLRLGGSGISAGGGTVTVQNRTAGTAIDLGGPDVTTSPLTLGLTDAEIRLITAGTLVVGRNDGTAAGDMTVSLAVSTALATNLTLKTGTKLTIAKSLTLPSVVGTLTLTAAGAVTEGLDGNITATNLLLNGAGGYDLSTATNFGNDVGTLAATGTAALSYKDNNALTIGVVGGVHGIDARGAVSIGSGGIASADGNLTVTEDVKTTDTSTAAIVLNAGVYAAAGTGAGGNIIMSGGRMITAGRATLYTGTVAGSAGVTALVGSGSGHFRYNSDEVSGSNNYSLALENTGAHAIYREAPLLTFTANNATITYGDTVPALTGTATGAQNGDVVTPSFSVDGNKSTSNNYIAGIHTLAPVANGLGYAVSTVSVGNGTLTVNRKAVTASGITVAGRAYNGTTAATVPSGPLTASGLIAQDVVTVVSATGTFADKNVANGKTVALSSIVYGGADVANYSITDQATTTASITPALLTITAPTVSKTYDGTTSATGTATTGTVYSGDTLTAGTLAFTSKNAGTNNKTVNASGYTVSDGVNSGNYTISYVANTSSTISKADVTVTAPVVTKTYDGTTNATGTSTLDPVALAGAGAGETVSSTGTLAFTNKDAGTGNKTVQASGLVIKDSGNVDVTGNYNVSYTDNTTSTIGKASLTVTAVDAARFVTEADTANFRGVMTTGYALNESAASAGALSGTAAVTRTNAGTNVAAGTYSGTLVPSGLSSSNYEITYVNGTFTIVPAGQLLITVPATTNTYGSAPVYGTPVAQYLNGANVITTLAAPTVVGNQYTYSDGAGGTAVFTLDPVVTGSTAAPISSAGLTRVGAYNIGSTNISTTSANFSNILNIQGSQTVTTKGVTASASGVTKPYDGTTSMAGAMVAVTGEAGDLLGATGTGAFDSKNAGTNLGYSVSGLALTGTDKANYYLTGGSSITGSNGVITPAALTLSTTDVSKPYDGTTSASGSLHVTGNTVLFAGDSVSGGSFAFTNKNASVGDKAVSVSGATVSDGNSGNNYAITYVNNTTSTISKATLNVTASTVVKTYDGTTSASGTATVGTLAGAGAGEVIDTAATLAFTNKNAGTNNKTVVASGLTIKDSANADVTGNYSITYVDDTASTINKADLTVSGITATSRAYNGTTAAATDTSGALTGSSGLITGDVVSVSATGTFADKNVANGKTVTLSGFQYGGADVANYNIIDQATTTADITQAALTITAPTVSKTYDGTTNATGTATTTGTVYSGDTLTAGTLAFADKNAGSGNKTVNASGYTVSDGSNSGNYAITYVANTVSTITPATLTVSGITAANKDYDGTTSATVTTSALTGASGLIAGDDVSVTSATGTFADKNVAIGKTVTLSGFQYGGVDLANYNIVDQATTTASIAPKQVTISGVLADTKPYDATTAATLSTPGSVSTGVGSETLTLSAGSASFADADAGVGKTVTATGYTLGNGSGGGLASNYVLTSTTATGTGTIDRAVLTVSANDASRVYDGVAYSGGNGVTYSAFAIGETAAVLTGSVAYTGASQGAVNAGTYAIDLSTSTLANANYTVTYSAGALNIARRPLALVGSHVYDGQTSLSATEVSASNLVAGDCSSGVASCGLSGFGLLGSANVNAGSQVMNVGNFAVGGSLAQNYTMTDATGTASVTPRTVTVSGMTTTNKTYNGNTDATAIVDNWGTANTGVGGQTLTLNHGSAAFASANAASNLTVTLGGYSLANATDGSGGLASNYQLASTTATTTASILQAPLRVYANNDAKFVTKADAAGYAGATITGFAPGETEAVLTSAPTITRSNAGTDTAGIYTGVLTASGVSAANYYVDTYVPGNYTVVPANQLLVRATPASNSYGVANPYAITSAEYFDGANVLTLPTATANGANSFTVNDGAGGSASFTLAPQAAVISGAGLLSAGSYQLGTSGAVSTVNPANFSNTVTVVGSHTVSPALLTANASGVSKVYDGGTSMSNLAMALAGLHSGDQVSVNGSGAFSQSNAGTGLAYSISGLALGGNDAGNYQLSNAGGLNGNNGSITPRTLVVTADNQTKVYDKQVFSGYTATLSGNGSAGSGFATGETLADLGGSLAYGGSAATAVNAGSHAIQASGLSASNYSISYVDGTLQITPAALTLSSASVSKGYDGTTVALGTAAVASGASGTLFGGDSLSGGTFAFTDKNAGTGKTVTASGITVVDGNGGNNYLVTYADNTTSTIRQANLVLTTNAVSKGYDGTTTALGAAAAVSSGTLFDGDSLSGGSFAFTDKNAGTGKTVTTSGVTVGDGTNNSNYAVTYVDNTASRIDQANIVLTTNAVSKGYDGTTTALGAAAAVSSGRLFDGDSLSGGSFAFTDKNAGTGKTVTTSGVTVGDGTNNSNYAVTYVDNTASRIDQANIVLTTNAVSKGYDGTTSAPGAATVSSGTLFSGDSLSGGTFTFADKNAGTGKTLTTSGVTVGDGTNNSNYAVTYVDNTASRIDQANLVLTTSAVSKGYDGTTTALGTAAVSSGTLFSGDSLSGGTFAFTDKNVGSGKAVTASGVTVADGNGGGNYAISYANNTASSIAAAAVSVTAPEVSKTYDGTTNATGNAAIGSLAGAAAGDRVAVAPTVRYTDKDAGVANKTTRATGMTILDGNGVDVTANYTVSYVDTTTSTISPAPLKVTANADARFVTQADTVGYHGAHYDGLVGGETSAVLGGTLAITRAHAGTDVVAGSYTGVLQPSGLSSGNYSITFLPGNYSIVPANQLLVRVDNTTTTYGTAATPSIASVQYLDADNVTIHTLVGNGTGSSFGYSDGAGGGVQFTLSPVGATTSTTGKTNVGNYALADAAPTVTGRNFSGAAVFVGNLDVQQKSVSASAAGVGKTYNGSTDMVGIGLGLAGLEAGDGVLVNGNGAFAQKNAGSNLQYLVRDLALSGPDAGNYYLVGGNSLAGNNGSITPAAISVTTGDVTKTYDGNTGAAGTAVLAAGQLFGSDALAGGSFAFDDKNVGAGKTVTPSGFSVADGNGGGNYTVTYVVNTHSSITRLGSVTWIGGPTGNWFDPANWAGGAVPDLANVANVVIPANVTVTFGPTMVGPAQAGPVQIDSLGTAGTLDMPGGQLAVGSGGINLGAVTQSGGSLSSTGNVALGSLNQTGGSLATDGNFSTTTNFAQTGTGTVAVGGSTQIVDTEGGATLGNLSSAGPLTVTSTDGPIGQQAGTVVKTAGSTSLTASQGGAPAGITLGGANQLGGPVSTNGANVAPISAAQTAGALLASTRDKAGDIGPLRLSGLCSAVMQMQGLSAGTARVRSSRGDARGAAFGFALPAVAADAVRAQTGSPAARLANGAALPGWLTFDAERLQLSAVAVPPGGLPIDVTIGAGTATVPLRIEGQAWDGSACSLR